MVGNELSNLEKELVRKYGNVKNETRPAIEGRSIAEQMAYEVLLNKPSIKKERREYRSILDRISQEIPSNKKFIPIPVPAKKKSEMKPALEAAYYYTNMGALSILIKLLEGIERASINYLNKTRPDLAQTLKKRALY